MAPSRYCGNETQISHILRSAKFLAVVGLSENPERPSYGVAHYLQQVGYKIIPVNPGVRDVLGERAYLTLGAVPGTIDAALVFRRAEYVPEIAREAIAKGVPVLWLQEGIRQVQAAAKAYRAGLTVIMDRCMFKEHRRLVAQGEV